MSDYTDLSFRLKSIENFTSASLSNPKEKALYLQNFRTLATARAILSTLNVGLNKRAQHTVPHFAENEIRFDLHEDKNPTSVDLYVGINLNIENAFNPLELGPAPHDPKVKEFMNFWGELSTLRRFPDGTTCEAVYFETKTIKEKREIVKKIIEFVTKEKLKLEYELYYDEFEETMFSKKLVAPFPAGTNEESSLKVISTVDELNKKLRSLQLPLEITSILGSSDVFR